MNHQGDYFLTDENNATIWGAFNQAQNAMNTVLSNKVKKQFFVEKSGKSSDLKTVVQMLIDADMSSFNGWLSSIGNFKRFVNTIDTEQRSLISELSNIDEEICYIRHYIEFGKLNAYQGWAAYEMLRESLLQRRKIKDALSIVIAVKVRKKDMSESDSVRNAIAKLNTRTYTPRKLDFLFEKCGTIECRISV